MNRFTQCVLFALCCLQLLDATDKPNIVFFIVDDQKRDFYSFLPDRPQSEDIKGSVTPNLDRLAKEGVVLAGMHVPSPVCIPSRFTALTGYYASRADSEEFAAGSWRFGFPWVAQNTLITRETKTIPKHLKKAGYRTGAVGKNHVIEVPGYVKIPSKADIQDPEIKKQLKRNAALEKQAWQAAGFDFAERLYHNNIFANGPRKLNPHNLDWITEGALKFIEDKNSKTPFYLYFSTTTPHGPFGDWQKGDRRATPEGMLAQAPQVLPSKQSIKQRLIEQGYGPKDRHWKLAGDTLWTDDAIGVIIDRLKAIGQWNNTIFIFFNDHGVESGKTTIYQGGMESIAVIYGPEHLIQNKGILHSLTSSVDLGTTILHWAGLSDQANQLDGVDLRPLLNSNAEKVRESVYGEMGISRAVRKANWKYIALREPAYLTELSLEERTRRIDDANRRMASYGLKTFPNKPTDPFAHIAWLPGGWDNTWSAMREHPAYHDIDQLYNLVTDPHEKNNLASDPQYKTVLAEMKTELSKHLKSLPGKFGEF